MSGTPPTPLRPRLRASRAVLGSLLLSVCVAVIAAGWIFTQRMIEYGSSKVRHDIGVVAATAAGSLDPQAVGELRGIPADAESTTHAAIRAQLGRIRDAIPDARFVYLVTHSEGRIVFLADAEPPDSPAYSPPGQVYDEAPAAFMQAFSEPPLVHGPYQDRRGDWVTGLAGVRGADGGPVRAVVGVDVSSSRYLAKVADYRNFAVAVAGLTVICTMLFAAILWQMQGFSRRLQVEMDELHRVQKRLGLASAVIESASEGVMVTDANLRIESVNPAFEQITGYPATYAVGRTPKILFSGVHDDAFFHRLRELVDTQGQWQGEIVNRRSNGELYPQETSIHVLRDAAGRISHYASVFSDSTAQHQLESRLREMALMDGLTGIANRRKFNEILAQEWARALRDGRPLSLLMVDIDFFKKYNDRHGHLKGDHCLQQVARAIDETATRAGDVVARYGGEEFAVILPMTDAAGATAMGERIRARVTALALPHGASSVAAFVTISVGAATTIPLQAEHERELIDAADRALYRAKHTGRNRVVTASEPSGRKGATDPLPGKA